MVLIPKQRRTPSAFNHASNYTAGMVMVTAKHINEEQNLKLYILNSKS